LSNFLNEEAVIEVFWKKLSELTPPGSSLKHLDDAMDLPLSPGTRFLITSIDGNTEKFSRFPWESPYDWGWRLLSGALTDIVAKGARPLGFMLDLGVPPQIDMGYLESLARGFADSAREHGVWFLGGDANRSEGRFSWVSIAVIGELILGSPIPRNGGRLGEGIYTTLVNGYGVTGLLNMVFYSLRKRPEEVLGRNVRWTPRAPLGFLGFAEEVKIGSSIDSSDGLLRSLIILSRSTGHGICLERLPPFSLPIDNIEHLMPEEGPLSILEKAVLEGGEEYEIVFSTSEAEEVVYRKCSNKGLRCIRIARYCGEEAGTVNYKGLRLRRGGWDNFRGVELQW